MEQPVQHNDLILFERIARGDEQAFAEFFNHYGRDLHSYLTTLTKSLPEAEELVQNTFIRVWLYRDKLPAIENPKAWVFTVASNEAYNFLKKKALQERTLEHLKKNDLPGDSPDEVLYNEMRSIIRAAVNDLPERRRLIYQLSKEQGMKQQDIADKLRISLSTVKNTLTAALEDIRAALEKHGLLVFLVLFTSIKK